MKARAYKDRDIDQAMRSAFHNISLLAEAILVFIMVILAHIFLLKSLWRYLYFPFVVVLSVLLFKCISTSYKAGLSRTRTIQLIIKRMFDISSSSLGILVLAPLLLLVSIVIKLTSRGPIFFKQVRVGLGGRSFQLYKFRTYYTDYVPLPPSPDTTWTSLEWMKTRKKWVTPFGRVLKKYSIDELPQLFNVLIGDMSIIGPRPRVPYEGLLGDSGVLKLLPGITCLWQVSGSENISFEDWMKLDQQYIEKWSLLLDFKILLRTVPAVLFGIGAY